MKTVLRMISDQTRTSTERVVKKIFLMKVIGTFWKKICKRVQTRVVDLQKAQLDIKKHGGRMMILVIVLVKSINYGKSRNKETDVR